MRLLVDQDVATTNLRLQRLDLATQRAIVLEERRAQLVTAFDQRFAHEDLPRLARRDGAVVDAAPG